MNKSDKTKNLPKTNDPIAEKVIELHNGGYVFDFMIGNDQNLICLQNNKQFPIENIQIMAVYQARDRLSQSYKYLHIVEPHCGDKGLLLLYDGLFT